MNSTSIVVGNLTLHVEQQGQGDPLLLLHGFTGCGADWAPFTERLATKRALIIPDLRGHGRSTNPGGTFTHGECARDISALLDQLGCAQVDAIGMSAGAKTLLHLATAEPSRVRQMILVSAAPYYPPGARELMRQFSDAARSEEEWQFMRSRHPQGDAQIRALWAQGRIFAEDSADMNFTPPRLGAITADTFLVHGDRDPFYPVSLALEMYKAIPTSRLWVIPDAGHVPIYGEWQAAFLEAAVRFFR
ncbi:MAG TPA: alpha/beta fold hydrolase [Terriglobia bacterium]|nr:alpha/beta fold hydrolase [Terriglobia bacterium]